MSPKPNMVLEDLWQTHHTSKALYSRRRDLQNAPNRGIVQSKQPQSLRTIGSHKMLNEIRVMQRTYALGCSWNPPSAQTSHAADSPMRNEEKMRLRALLV
ncbi:hypothetical protein ACFX2I_012202 [Malus domestica]